MLFEESPCLRSLDSPFSHHTRRPAYNRSFHMLLVLVKQLEHVIILGSNLHDFRLLAGLLRALCIPSVHQQRPCFSFLILFIFRGVRIEAHFLFVRKRLLCRLRCNPLDLQKVISLDSRIALICTHRLLHQVGVV